MAWVRTTLVWGAMTTALGLAAVGCGHAVHARRGSTSGEVRVGGVLGLSDAHVLMAEHCGGRFRVVTDEEGLSLALRDADDGKPTVADLEVAGERLHYICTSRRADAR